MQTIVNIQGMTCNGCKSSVKKAIENIAGVSKATVSLDEGKAVVVSNKILDIAILREALSTKYTIDLQSNIKSIVTGREMPEPHITQNVSKLKQLKPLFFILGYIAITSLLLHHKQWDVNEIMLSFMGLFFIIFSFFKLLDLKGFAKSFAMYDPLALKVTTYAWVYPFIEIGLGLMLLLRWKVYIAFIITIIVLGVTTIGVTQSLLRKEQMQCACLGTALKLPMTEATFIENAIMICMAIVALWMA